MAFHSTTIMDLWEIVRRWHTGRHSISQIARELGFDWKTIQGYIQLAKSVGLTSEEPLPEKEEVLRRLHSVKRQTPLGRHARAQALLLPHLDEVAQLINDHELALKPKSAFRVICERHDLTGTVGYSAYKRFVRAHQQTIRPGQSTCRIEVAPGSELQIDYARVGILFDPTTNRRRTLYSFIGTLSHSRMKYVELTFSQDQRSFVSSHVRMVEFFGGAPTHLKPDNLKPAVISPSLYDPALNRSYAEMAEYYGCFIDPARVRHPKDKGKVERDVKTVREAVRIQLVLHPTATLAELNRLIKHWSLNEYGQQVHGTTGEKPFVVFTEQEKPALKSLPDRPFDLAEWKQATVHPDHFIQFHGKSYSIPHAYVGKKVWIRASGHILKVFFNEELIKQHTITSHRRHTDYEDFPENIRSVIDTSYVHKRLLDHARTIGSQFSRMIKRLLDDHAYLNLRRAQGISSVAERIVKDNPTQGKGLLERAAQLIDQHQISPTPQTLRSVVLKLQSEATTPAPTPLSEATTEFLRDPNYFTN